MTTENNERISFLPHLAMQVFNTPLMILPQKLEVITKVLGERIGMEGGEIPPAEMAKKARTPVSTKKKEIGVVPIIGSLAHRASFMDGMSGVTSYEKIRSSFREHMSDPSVGAILLDIDSPGGVVAGVFDLADEIHEANKTKPVYAYVNEHAYSAGYLLASAAGKILLPRTGGTGSIGVRMIHVDQSELNKKVGIKVTNLFVGERKLDFDPNSELSKEAYHYAMKELNEMYEIFTDSIARYRGMSVADVKNTEAALYMGKNAVRIGLADDVMTFDEAVSFIEEDMAVTSNRTMARGAKPKEVKHTMPNTITAEFMAENPELYHQIRASDYPELYHQIRAEAERDLRASFEAEKHGLEAQVAGLKVELQERDKHLQAQETRILKLEKAEYIRLEQEKANRVAASSERIWTKALAVCEIPEKMHGKVRAMVSTDAYVREDILDEEAYTKAVQSEIEEWEGKGMTTSILGTGFGNKDDGDNIDPKAKSDQHQTQEDDAWVQKMLSLAGQKGGEV